MSPRLATRAVSCCFFILVACCLTSVRAYGAGRQRLPTFRAIGLATGTDKVTHHAYDNMYDRYLPKYRFTSVRFLEIGLGCDMRYGPGRSFKAWYTYFIHQNSTIDFMEFNGECAEKFKSMSTRGEMLVGDQGNEEHLQRVIDRGTSIGGYDIIVDDGGHTFHQQLLSFKKLWPLVNPGGIYVMEDLQTSYMRSFQGGPPGTAGTAIAWIKGVIDMLNCNSEPAEPSECLAGLLNLDCYSKVCVFGKATRD